MECPICLGVQCNKKKLEDHVRDREGFLTVRFRMASRVFLFFTPSDSSLVRNWFVCSEPRTPVVKLVWEAFHPLFSRWLRWLMKPNRELYLWIEPGSNLNFSHHADRAGSIRFSPPKIQANLPQIAEVARLAHTQLSKTSSTHAVQHWS